ncbi:MAG: alanine racemase [Myxococcales bacterium]|nr:alanine racemase [Myxococcales bacterium]
MFRATRAEIDLDAIGQNLAWIRGVAPGCALYAMVKANAYGHGLVEVARAAAVAKVDGFGVALVEEGIVLRDAGIELPVVVLNGLYGNGHREVLERDLVPVVYREADLVAFEAAVRATGRSTPLGVHLKLDTGMSRLGCDEREFRKLVEGIESSPGLRLAGVMTHLSAGEDPAEDDFSMEQIQRFGAMVDWVRSRGHAPWIHAANSGALVRLPPSRFDLLRAGLLVYGIDPSGKANADLRPAMRWVSSVAMVHELSPGDSVGYNRTFRAPRSMRVGTIPMGYGDGYLRSGSNRAKALVGGQLCPVVGRISMDLLTVDLSSVPGAGVGDEAVLLGAQGGECITAHDLGAWAGTSAYEVVTNLSARVRRVHRATTTGEVDGG